jgi:hypothetical protein
MGAFLLAEWLRGRDSKSLNFFADPEVTAEFLVNRCEIPHGVRRVLGGNRTSLLFFLSGSPLSIPNTQHKQI